MSPGSEDLTINGQTNHTSLVKLRQKPGGRKLSNQEEINKRLSLPADLKIPENFLSRQTVSPTLEGPLSRYVTWCSRLLTPCETFLISVNRVSSQHQDFLTFPIQNLSLRFSICCSLKRGNISLKSL